MREECMCVCIGETAGECTEGARNAMYRKEKGGMCEVHVVCAVASHKCPTLNFALYFSRLLSELSAICKALIKATPTEPHPH